MRKTKPTCHIVKIKKTFSVHQFELLQSKLNSLIEKSKSNYYTHLSKKRQVRNPTGLD